MGELLDGELAVRRRVTDVVGLARDDVRVLLAKQGDDPGGLVDREGRLRDEGDLIRIGDLDGGDVLGRLDEDDRVGSLAGRALDLLVAIVADRG